MQFSPPRADELPLIYDSWARSFRKSPWAGCVPNHLWDSVSRTCISELLSRGAKVIVAYVELEGGTRRVMGYSVSEPEDGVLHYLYVKRDFRLPGQPVERELLSETVRDFPPHRTPRYTHKTLSLARLLGHEWTHDPVPARVK